MLRPSAEFRVSRFEFCLLVKYLLCVASDLTLRKCCSRMLLVGESARACVSALFWTQLCTAAPRVLTARDVVEETRRTTRIFCDPHFLRCEALFDFLNMLEQCLSTVGPRPGTWPWHQLHRAVRGSPGICHFSFLSNFHE